MDVTALVDALKVIGPLLGLGAIVALYTLHKEMWVPGWLYRKEIARGDKAEESSKELRETLSQLVNGGFVRRVG